MTALARNFARPHKVHDRQMNIVPANAGEKFYVGGYLLREAATGLCTKVIAEGNIPLGVTVEPLFADDPDRDINCHLDNTAGDDGVLSSANGNEVIERCVRYDRVGEYEFDVEGATPLIEQPAYLVDDNTVTAEETAEGIIAGHFTRPAPHDGRWYVDIAKRSTLS